MTHANRSSKALIKTCIRHAQSQLALDLSDCKHWLRFAEIHYSRPGSTAEAVDTPEVLQFA